MNQRPAGILKSRRERVMRIALVGCLVMSYLILADTTNILASAGGLVFFYLLAVPFAILPLGWSNNNFVKIAAALAILVAIFLANRDHTMGLAYQARVLKIRYTAGHQSDHKATSQRRGAE